MRLSPHHEIIRADGFCFQTEAKVPLIAATLNGEKVKDQDNKEDSSYKRVYGNTTGFPAKPMQRFITASNHNIVLYDKDKKPYPVQGWLKEIVRSNLPKALWDNWPGVNNTYTNDDYQRSILGPDQTLPNHWVGVKVTAEPTRGTGLAPMPIERLGDKPLNSVISTIPPQNRELSGVFKIDVVAKSITTAASKRSALTNQLGKIGFFVKSNYSESLKSFGNEAQKLLLHRPL